MQNEKSFNLQCCKLTFRNDGILVMDMHKGTHMTVEYAKEILSTVQQEAPDTKFPVLMLAKNVKGADKEARRLFKNTDPQHPGPYHITKVCAMVVGSGISKMIGNMVIIINKPPFPAKLFSDEEKAITWLKEFKD